MNALFSKALPVVAGFFGKQKNRRLLYVVLLCIVALIDYMHSGLVRRTFMFYTVRNSSVVVEERWVRRSGNRETDIRRYVEGALLGSKSPEVLSLPFHRETQVQTLLYRNGVVFVNLSEYVADPPVQEGSAFHSFLTLNEGIRRNFPFVEDVRFFIEGNQIFFENFQQIFAESADNNEM
ncbi:MAG: hypothetical protein FWD91_04900 [Treponema sp.]|nr:hypothetical protein [Treponema sp.]